MQNTHTNHKADDTDKHKKRKQWLWFIGLWCASLTTVLTLGYGIKFLMSLI